MANSGRFSKFQELLRNIRLSRLKREKFQKENEAFVQEKVKEIKETIQKDKACYRIRVPRGVQGVTNKKVTLVKKEKQTQKVIISPQTKTLLEDNISSSNKDDKEIKKNQDLYDEKILVVKKKKVGIAVDDDLKLKDETVNNLSRKKRANDSLEKSKKDEESLISLQEFEVKKNEEHSNSSEKIKPKKFGYSFERDISQRRARFRKLGDSEKKEYLKNLESEIIYKIKEQFENYLDEVDVLSGELYLLDDRLKDEVELSKVILLKKKIHDLVEKINYIIDQYNLYQKNVYLDHVVGLEDVTLIDDIIDYRDLLELDCDKKNFTKEYKKLEEFKRLHDHLLEVREETMQLIDQNQEKVVSYEERDKKYKKMQQEFRIDSSYLLKCNQDIKKQDEYFAELNKKIGNIQSEEYTTYRLRGLDQLVNSGLRYLGTMMMSPFSGLIPSIGMQALATRRMVRSAYQNMHIEEVRHVRYSATDYEKDILSKLTDINYTSDLLEQTLNDVYRLKEKFLLQYQSNIPGYDEFLKKINILEEKVLHQQNRVDLVKKRVKKSQKLNEQKMMRVKNLNQNN